MPSSERSFRYRLPLEPSSRLRSWYNNTFNVEEEIKAGAQEASWSFDHPTRSNDAQAHKVPFDAEPIQILRSVLPI